MTSVPRVLIPTRNRPASLGALVAYLDEFYPDARIIVADGSTEEHAAINARNMKDPGHRIEIEYRPYPASVSLFDRLLDVLGQLPDDYLIMGSDDDFPVIDNLSKAFTAIRDKPDISTVLGATIHFTLKPGNELYARLGVARPIMGPDPLGRARSFAQWMFSTTYAVSRRELLIERFKRSKEVFLPGFYDYGVGIHDVLHGKMHAIPEFTFFATRNFNHSYLRTEDPLHFIRNSEDFFKFAAFIEHDIAHYCGKSDEAAAQIASRLLLRQIGVVAGFPAPKMRGFEQQPSFRNAVVQQQLADFDAIFRKATSVRETYADRLGFIVDKLKQIAQSADNAGEAVTVASLAKQTASEATATADNAADTTRMFRTPAARRPAAAIEKPLVPGQVPIDADTLLHRRDFEPCDIHVLVLGQSNGANHGETRLKPGFGRMTTPDGGVVPLADPVAGGTGEGGSVWTRLAELLQRDELATNFTVTMRSVSGTSIADWSSGGAQFAALDREIARLAGIEPPITHVVWHQGERDTYLGTQRRPYVAALEALMRRVAQDLPDAKWIVCRASYRMGQTSDQVIGAQNAVIQRNANCWKGPNTDVLTEARRYDNTHLNDAGLGEFAQMLSAALQATLTD